MLAKAITQASNDRFDQDVEYLSKLFDDTDNIEGCVVKIVGQSGLDNYNRHFCDPYEEQTLKFTGRNEVILFYKHTVKNLPVIDVCNGVSIVNKLVFRRGYKVDSYWWPPVNPPNYLESYILKCVNDAFANIKIGDFFQQNFVRGGMMPLKEMKKHPEWQTKYIGQIDVKDVNICKSCKSRAYSGCCPDYSAKNRTKIRMVVGWHASG